MATSALFGLLDALVAAATAALPSVSVYDGYADADVLPTSGLVIGIPDPTDEDAALSAQASQEWANTGAGRTRDESGDIYCVAWATDGSNRASTARASVQAIVSAVENLLRANVTLSQGQLIDISFGSDVQLMQDQDDTGALAQVTFSIHYRARI